MKDPSKVTRGNPGADLQPAYALPESNGRLPRNRAARLPACGTARRDRAPGLQVLERSGASVDSVYLASTHPDSRQSRATARRRVQELSVFSTERGQGQK